MGPVHDRRVERLEDEAKEQGKDVAGLVVSVRLITDSLDAHTAKLDSYISGNEKRLLFLEQQEQKRGDAAKDKASRRSSWRDGLTKAAVAIATAAVTGAAAFLWRTFHGL